MDELRSKSRTAVVMHDYLKPSYAAAMAAKKGDVVVKSCSVGLCLHDSFHSYYSGLSVRQQILDDRDKEWCLCLLDGRKGFIPTSFIQRALNQRDIYQKQVSNIEANAAIVKW